MIAKGKDLIFIAFIKPDGLSVKAIENQKEIKHLKNTEFELSCLSITNETYIAHELNTYIVKRKLK